MTEPALKTEEERFHDERQKILGGTDMAAIMGVNKKYGSPMKVWREKMGLAPPYDAGDTAEAGLVLEPWLIRKAAALIEDRTAGAQTVVHASNDPDSKYYHFLRHPKYPFLGGHVDGFRVVVATGDIIGPVECKAFGPYAAKDWGEPWTDEIPDKFLVQVQHYIGLDDSFLESLVMAFCWGQDRAQPYPVKRNNSVIATIHGIGIEFYENYILAEKPPPVDDSKASEDTLREMYPSDNGGTMQALEELIPTINRLKGLTLEKAEVESRMQDCKNKIIKELGENSIMDTPEGRISFKKSKDSEKIDRKAVISALEKNLPADGKAILQQTIVDNTKPKPGSRRFLTPPDWKKEQEG
jgi:predicted phage-related endonuclease